MEITKDNFHFEVPKSSKQAQIFLDFIYLCAMKMVFSVLSLYFLTLSCIPCTDQVVEQGEERRLSTIVQDQHDHNEAQTDLCSPLCICNCCRSYFQSGWIGLVQPLTLLQNDKNDFYISHSPSFLAHAVWQPPKYVLACA